MQKRVLFLTVFVMMLTAITVSAQEAVTLRYWLWDTNQLPPYQQCADNFMAANPNITVQVEQLGWGDYWTGITTGFVSGDAPDVFTNHLAKYPEFVALEQLVDIQPLVERDAVDTSVYIEGLADLWMRDGSRYGLPKDWDTVALIYNADMIAAAGVDPAALNELAWNTEDGGSFQEMVATLTLDANGNNGLSADFDKTNVTQYGFLYNSAGGFSGQTEYSAFTGSTGWYYTNGTWGDEYYYDDARFIDTIDWWTGLWLDHGFAPQLADVQGLGQLAMFQAGTGAMALDGSWMIGSYLSSEFPVGFARLPMGPEGRASMFNGLADSIWVGTPHQEEAWQLVKYLASPECELIVGESGVVFPATAEGVAASLAVRADAGVDVSAFTEQALEEGGTFLFPITDFGGEIATIMAEVMDSIALGLVEPADAIPAANAEINALFD